MALMISYMEALRVGIGMVSRGEVAMVLITTMITPVLLKMVYSSEILE
ncbi:hypothetical protein [Caldanaerobius fijiensis]|nr:hypothetical protein [Caldanaerobius fijiensis]